MKLSVINDEFNVRFEKVIEIIRDQLKKEDIWIVEEIALKTFFNVTYDTNTLYNKIRYILENTDLRVKIDRNKIIDEKRTNLFGFYLSYKIDKVREKRKEKKNEIIENQIRFENERKEKIKNLIREDVINVENKSKDSINYISTNIPLPYTSICLKCRKKVIIIYPELKCPNCEYTILKNWD